MKQSAVTKLLRKIDILSAAILFIIIYWFAEAAIHLLFFSGMHISGTPHSTHYLDELLHPNKHELYMRLLVSSLLLLFGLISQYIINKLRFLALHDPITKAPNRILVEEKLEHIYQAKSKKYTGHFALVKINQLSLIQSELGGEYVNNIISQLSERFKRHLFDEWVGSIRFSIFSFVIYSQNAEQAVMELKRKIISIMSKPIEIDGIPFHLDMNIGLLPIADYSSSSSLINSTYKALSQSYKTGNGTCTTIVNDYSNSVKFIAQFYNAVKSDQFKIYLQPKISMSTNKLVGYEALSRWEHPKQGLISPDAYIHVAEKTQAIHLLSKSVVRKSIEIFKQMQSINNTVSLSINLSAKDIIDTMTIKKLLNQLNVIPENRHLISFEITETSFMHKPNIAIKSLQAIAESGFKITLDDFGTGYSSYAYFKEFSIHELKIDKTFVDTVINNKKSQCIIKNMVLLSHDLNATVCAEGVETEDQRDILLSLGCDVGQGYLWHKPLPYETALKLL